MNERRWINQHQPQTLVTGTILCYVEAVIALLNFGLISIFGLALAVGLGAGGYGIANEKKWGYGLAVASAILLLLLYVAFGLGQLTNVFVMIPIIFVAALVTLLLHPMSRDYQRIWFK